MERAEVLPSGMLHYWISKCSIPVLLRLSRSQAYNSINSILVWVLEIKYLMASCLAPHPISKEISNLITEYEPLRTLMSYFLPTALTGNRCDLNARERRACLGTIYKVTYKTRAIKQHPGGKGGAIYRDYIICMYFPKESNACHWDWSVKTPFWRWPLRHLQEGRLRQWQWPWRKTRASWWRPDCGMGSLESDSPGLEFPRYSSPAC